MAELLILQGESRESNALLRALESRYRCRRIRDLREVDEHASSKGPRGCILDLSDPAIPVPLTHLRHLRQRHAGLALLVVGDFSGREMDLYHLGRVSVDGVIRLEESPSHRQILEVVEGAFSTRLAEVVVETVGQDLPPLAREAVRWTIENADSRPRVEDLASALGLSPRTLLRELKAARLSPPRTLLLWGRLIQASHLLERPWETVETVAFRLGYATAGTLRKALKLHVGSTPTGLQRRGGLKWTLGVFGREGLRRETESRERWAGVRRGRWRVESPARRQG